MTYTDWLTLALVLVTAFYAWATFRILRANEAVVKAMESQTEAQLRPYVVASVASRVGTNLLSLEIQNTGRSPAENLTLKMDKDFYPHALPREKSISALPAFTQPIESLPPGAALRFVLGAGGTIFAQGIEEAICPKVFSIHATYQFAGHIYRENNTIDFRPMLNSALIHDPVASEIRQLRELLDRRLSASSLSASAIKRGLSSE